MGTNLYHKEKSSKFVDRYLLYTLPVPYLFDPLSNGSLFFNTEKKNTMSTKASAFVIYLFFFGGGGCSPNLGGTTLMLRKSHSNNHRLDVPSLKLT